MGRNDLLKEPHNVVGSGTYERPEFWWYEDDDGITVVSPPQSNRPNDTRIHKIKWSSVRAALKRKDK